MGFSGLIRLRSDGSIEKMRDMFPDAMRDSAAEQTEIA